MLRRFSTSHLSLATARARMAPRSAKTSPIPAKTARSAQTGMAPVATKTPSPATHNAQTSPATASSTSTASTPSTASSSPSTASSTPSTASPPVQSKNSAIMPRLVPELHKQPSATPVSETVDAEEVVDTLGDSESLADDWGTSFQGLGQRPFDRSTIDILLAPVVNEDVEITPDGLLYLPEIKYRRILNRAFGPGGWGIAPRTKTLVTKRQVTREYGLVCLGRLVSVSRGEMDFFSAEGVTTAMEGCKSNALMRCCKDLGIASELWDPAFIRVFKRDHCDSKYFEKKRRFVWKRKDRPWEYPYNQ